MGSTTINQSVPFDDRELLSQVAEVLGLDPKNTDTSHPLILSFAEVERPEDIDLRALIAKVVWRTSINESYSYGKHSDAGSANANAYNYFGRDDALGNVHWHSTGDSRQNLNNFPVNLEGLEFSYNSWGPWYESDSGSGSRWYRLYRNGHSNNTWYPMSETGGKSLRLNVGVNADSWSARRCTMKAGLTIKIRNKYTGKELFVAGGALRAYALSYD